MIERIRADQGAQESTASSVSPQGMMDAAIPQQDVESGVAASMAQSVADMADRPLTQEEMQILGQMFEMQLAAQAAGGGLPMQPPSAASGNPLDVRAIAQEFYPGETGVPQAPDAAAEALAQLHAQRSQLTRKLDSQDPILNPAIPAGASAVAFVAGASAINQIGNVEGVVARGMDAIREKVTGLASANLSTADNASRLIENAEKDLAGKIGNFVGKNNLGNLVEGMKNHFSELSQHFEGFRSSFVGTSGATNEQINAAVAKVEQAIASGSPAMNDAGGLDIKKILGDGLHGKLGGHFTTQLEMAANQLHTNVEGMKNANVLNDFRGAVEAHMGKDPLHIKQAARAIHNAYDNSFLNKGILENVDHKFKILAIAAVVAGVVYVGAKVMNKSKEEQRDGLVDQINAKDQEIAAASQAYTQQLEEGLVAKNNNVVPLVRPESREIATASQAHQMQEAMAMQGAV